ncbi:unnamed protein product, partial [Polarella glacialis]
APGRRANPVGFAGRSLRSGLPHARWLHGSRCFGAAAAAAAACSRPLGRAVRMMRSAAAAGPGLVVVIAGPTAAGKSDAAAALADRLAADGRKSALVSADSVQVYKGLDVGSNKPTKAEQEQWPIQLIDWMEPEESCTAGLWTREAFRIIDEILSRGEVPIVVGGSCMYLDWLVKGEPDAGKSDPSVVAAI